MKFAILPQRILFTALLFASVAFQAFSSGIVSSLTEADLRAALVNGGTLTFSADGVITLTNYISIANATTLDGSGHKVTISGGGTSRVFVVQASGDLTLSNLTIADGLNIPPGSNGGVGGGAVLNAGKLTVFDCTFTNNVSTVGILGVNLGTDGGAIYHDHDATKLCVSRTLFINNRSLASGGGAIGFGWNLLYGGTGNILVTNCTFYGNSGASNTSFGAGAVTLGGPFTGPIAFVNCTFDWNTNGAISHGDSPYGPTPHLPILINCVVANSVGLSNAWGILDQGHNLSSDNSSAFSNSTSRTNQDPGLGLLGYYGGSTLAVPLLDGSPALEAGDDRVAPAVDQRGVPRPFGNHSDIGAFERDLPSTEPSHLSFTTSQYFVLGSARQANFQIERTGSLNAAATVAFSAQPGTATDGVDFVATNAVLTFTNYEMQKTIAVDLFGHQVSGIDKTVLLSLHDPTNAVLDSPSTSTLTILDISSNKVVTNFTDLGLRAAIAGGGNVQFNRSGVIALTNTIIVDKPVILDGTSNTVMISGGSVVRLFQVDQNVDFAIRSLTLADGMVRGEEGSNTDPPGPGKDTYGAGILNLGGNVSLIDCVLFNHSVFGGQAGHAASFGVAKGGDACGGALCSLGGKLSLTNCIVSGCWVVGGVGSSLDPGGFASNGSGGNGLGGAVYGADSLVNLANVTLETNSAYGGAVGSSSGAPVFNGEKGGGAAGGAVCITNSTATLVSSLLIGNTVAGASSYYASAGVGVGGGIFISDGSIAEIFESQIMSNTASCGIGAYEREDGRGGGAFNAGVLRVTRTSFSGNRALGGANKYYGGMGLGGAIWSSNATTIVDSSFYNNAALGAFSVGQSGAAAGGAIWSSGMLNSTNLTLTANQADAGDADPRQVLGQPANGGGIAITGGTVTLVNLTMSSNLSNGGVVFDQIRGTNGPSLGGNLSNTNGTVLVLNSILANSTHGSNAWGVHIDGGFNLSSDASCAWSAGGSLNNTDPKLGPLGDYGGPTLTMPLLAGSPAIDGGGLAAAPSTDQRGRARPFGNGVDIGAFESSPPFVLSGRVSGFTLTDEVPVSVGSASILTTNRGMFRFDGLPSGTQSFGATHSNYVFVPSIQNVTLGPDRLDMNIQAFRWQTLSPEPVTNGAAHLVLAAPAGSTWQILVSTNAEDWIPVSTNTAGNDNLIERFFPLDGTPNSLYRAAMP